MACSTRGTPSTWPAITRPLSSRHDHRLVALGPVGAHDRPAGAGRGRPVDAAELVVDASTRAAGSNSVPPPRPWAERRPTSRMRARSMRSSASSRRPERRVGPGARRAAAGAAWRAASPSGPSTRTDELGRLEPAPAARARCRVRRRDGARRPARSRREPGGCRPAATAPARRRAPPAAGRPVGLRHLPDDLAASAAQGRATAGQRPARCRSAPGAGASAQSTSGSHAAARRRRTRKPEPAVPSATTARRREADGDDQRPGDRVGRGIRRATGARARWRGCRRARRRR